MNRNILGNILKSEIENLYGERFNEVIDKIFFIIYGEKYKSIKQKKDLGSDGILEMDKERLSLACYAPEKYRESKFKEKIDEDFEKYKRSYKKLGYKWWFITNQKLLGSMFTYIRSKDSDIDIWGREELINSILSQPPSKRRKILLDVFSFSQELIIYDFIEEIIYEIIENKKSKLKYKPCYSVSVDTYEKIKRNFTGEDIEIMKRKFEYFYADNVTYIEKVLNSFDNDFISNLKEQVLREYQYINEKFTFKKKFCLLVDRFSSKYPEDQWYKNYVELILLYLFEQCLIGTKPEVRG